MRRWQAGSSQIGFIRFFEPFKHLRCGDRPFWQMRIERARADIWRVEPCVAYLVPSCGWTASVRTAGKCGPSTEPVEAAGPRLVYRRVDALRTATEPSTAQDIVERVLAANNIERPDKRALADPIGTINSSLRKGVQRVNEGSPARWSLATN
jgi:hypothetical protein